MRRILVWVISVLVISQSLSAQKNVKGTLSTTKLVNVEIMHVQPLNKNKVNLVFRAETLEGEPAWNLNKEDVIVKEDGASCEILSLEPISKNRPISIALVIDHSGSMSFSWNLADIIKLIRGRKDSIISPLEYSKRSAKAFISSFNLNKDFVSVTGFGSSVDLEIPLTQDALYLNESIDSIQIEGSTALYDAMLVAMKQLKKAKGVKIVVALTDGMENASKSTWNDVVNYSTKNNIPVYSVGLGSVDKDTLISLARETKGGFYHTNKSASLVDIYRKISKQIQSFYALEYRSGNAGKVDSVDNIQISFAANSIYLLNDPSDPDVKAYFKKKKFEERLYVFGIVSVSVIAGAGVIYLLYRMHKARRKRRETIVW